MNANRSTSSGPMDNHTNLTDEQQLACYRELGLSLNPQNPWGDRA
jgi:hypothetical protein